MAKKKTDSKKECVCHEIFDIVVLAVVATALFVGSLTFAWLNSKTMKTEYELKTEINTLHNKIIDIAKFIEMPDAEYTASSAKSSAPSTSQSAQDVKEFRFTSCGYASKYVYEDWYDNMRNKLSEIGLSPKSVTSACYSEEGSILILIAQKGAYCEGPQVYKYNISINKLLPATVLSKDIPCLPPVNTFGKRNADLIRIETEGEEAGCKWETAYDYDYIKNAIELKSKRTICEGDASWTVKEY